MTIYEMLEELQEKAMHDPILKADLLSTKLLEDPLFSFCKRCQFYGYEIYPMELVLAGEEAYAAMKRSTNGGGENSPMLEGQDDLYEMFIVALEQSK